jgi:hypothetical protein
MSCKKENARLSPPRFSFFLPPLILLVIGKNIRGFNLIILYHWKVTRLIERYYVGADEIMIYAIAFQIGCSMYGYEKF